MSSTNDPEKAPSANYWLIPTPKIALPIFLAAFLIALFGRSLLGPATGIAALFFLLLFPFYVVRLLIGLKVQEQQNAYRARGFSPTYTPRWRAWTGAYVGLFLLTAWIFFLASDLAKT